MRRRQVTLTPEALDDLDELIEWMGQRVGAEAALAYATRLEDYCAGLAFASERGQRRDDLRPGVRMIGFGRRVAILFAVFDDEVTVLRLHYGGRNWTG